MNAMQYEAKVKSCGYQVQIQLLTFTGIERRERERKRERKRASERERVKERERVRERNREIKIWFLIY